MTLALKRGIDCHPSERKSRIYWTFRLPPSLSLSALSYPLSTRPPFYIGVRDGTQICPNWVVIFKMSPNFRGLTPPPHLIPHYEYSIRSFAVCENFSRAKKGPARVIYGAMRSMRTPTPPPPFPLLKIYPCAYVLLSICLFVCTTFFCFSACLSSCPASPSVHPSTRPSACPSLLDHLFVLRHSVFTYDCPSVLGKAYAYSPDCAHPN